tara:strand:+ start:283 stop:546 length:264 start_codon:yes stop_codon:yes gene_type:complete
MPDLQHGLDGTPFQTPARYAWAIAAIVGAVTVLLNVGPCDANWKFVEREAFATSTKETDNRLDKLDQKVATLSEKIDLVLELLNNER